jgi:PAS domain S-box-containing protein
MSPPPAQHTTVTETQWKIAVVAFSAAALILTVFCLSRGITVIFMHFYYIPIVLLAYHYRKAGYGGIVLLCLSYLALTLFYDWGEIEIIGGAVVRTIVFLGIGALVIILSDHLVSAQKELGKSLEIRTSIIQNANVWLMVIDTHGRILEWNTAAEEMSGYPAESVLGKNEIWRQLYPEKEQRREITRQILEIIEKDSFLENLKTRITCRDGSEKIMLWNTKILPGEENDPKRFISIGIDITDLTLAEEKMRESDKRYRTLYKNMLGGFAYCRMLYRDGRPDDFLYISVNEAFGNLTGLRDVEGKLATDVIPEIKEKTPELFDIYARVAETGIPEQFEINFTPLGIHLFISVYSPERGYFVALFENITERRRAENALRRSEERFRSLVETTSDFVWEVDVGGAYTYASPQVRKILGYEQEELIGKTPFDFMPPEEAQRVSAEFFRIVNSRLPISALENRCLHRNGNVVILETSGVPWLTEDGSLIGYRGIDRDITRRKQAEESLRETNEYLRNLLNHANAPIMVWDPEFRITRFNHAFERLTGRTEGEVAGKHLSILFPEESRDTSLDQIRTTLAGERWESVEIPIQHISGDTHIVLWNSANILDPAGTIISTIAQGQDITERKRTEEALRTNEEQLSLVIEGSGVGLWDWNIQTGKTVFNERWAEIAGYSLSELSPLSIETWTTLCHPEDLAISDALLKEHFAKKSPRYECEARIRHKDGHWVWVLDRGKVVEWDRDDRPIRMAGTHLDITDRKQVEEALRMANKKLNLLSSITRHDILNQLAALQGYLELTEDYDVEPTLQKYLDRMKIVSQAIQKQIEFTRIYQDIGIVAPAWQEVRRTIVHAAQALTLGEIRIEEENTDVWVLADPLFEKVFYNLFDNALKYGEKITRIRCSTVRGEEILSLVIEDDGVGVSMADKKRLFERGFGKHTGFGLFLSREILAITGITITEKGEPGMGARFEIVVPSGGFRFDLASNDSDRG